MEYEARKPGRPGNALSSRHRRDVARRRNLPKDRIDGADYRSILAKIRPSGARPCGSQLEWSAREQPLGGRILLMEIESLINRPDQTEVIRSLLSPPQAAKPISDRQDPACRPHPRCPGRSRPAGGWMGAAVTSRSGLRWAARRAARRVVPGLADTVMSVVAQGYLARPPPGRSSPGCYRLCHQIFVLQIPEYVGFWI